jgi:uncharacterized membrane protein required for colicin V production
MDFIIGIYLAALGVRGWVRGLIREVLDLVALVLGAAIAFRLAGPVGDFLTDRFGVTSEWARIGAGVVLFSAVGVGLALANRTLSRMMSLPGLNLLNRIGGVALAAAWGVMLLAVVLTILRAVPVADVSDAIDESRMASVLAGPDSVPVQILTTFGGERVASAVALLENLAGGRRLVVEGDDHIALAPNPVEVLSPASASAEELYVMLNRDRLAGGADPLPWSSELAAVATAHANEMYREGYLAHSSSTTGKVEDRVRAAGLPFVAAGEAIGLASTTRAVQAALLESDENRATMLNRGFDRVGIGVVAGPYGLLVVEVFTE